MNKYILISSIFISLFTFAETNIPNVNTSTNLVKTSSEFTYSPGHFRFQLPYYWEIISDKTLKSYINKLKEIYPGKPTPNYVLAIQRKALYDFTMPYALIEIDKRPMPTQKEVDAETASFDSNIRRAYVALYKKGLFGEINPLPAVYDPVNKVILGRCSMYRAKDKQYLTTITAIYPCSYGYVRFHFTFKTEDEEKFFPVIEKIIKSLKFDNGFEYKPALAKKNKGLLSRPIYVVVLVLAVIWFGFRIFGKIKK